MSRRGEITKKGIQNLREQLEPHSGKNVAFMQEILGILEDLNLRIQEMERENAPSDAFVDPNEGSHPVR